MHTIQLQVPARKGEREITQLTFADLKIKHMLVLDKHPPNSLAGDVALVSALTGESELIIGEIAPEDWPKISAYLSTLSKRFRPAEPREDQKEGPTLAGTKTPQNAETI